MSLFSDLGEKVERFKQSAVSASEDQAEFVCRACEEPVFTDQETCPHCGAEAVERVARPEDAEAGNREADGPEDPTSAERDAGTGPDGDRTDGTDDE